MQNTSEMSKISEDSLWKAQIINMKEYSTVEISKRVERVEGEKRQKREVLGQNGLLRGFEM